ncbi:PASTA domain-containing protein [Rhodococcus sp. AW25M09]|uniref:PASTA domain-containing protein n=1 Tax=Rhodococcus sp. AW25M09 TaxID=1268303 RepID=UPI0009DA8377|nr:PASTA domain-containing protein [Rhodococcus sp. AW25M09]
MKSVVLCTFVAVTTAACGSTDSEVGTEVRTVTVQETAPSPTSVPRLVVPDAASEPSVLEPSATSEPAAAEPVPAFMPSVVCMNLQTAQNAIQSAGVFYSRSVDASGDGRMQINDSNWIVVAQEPPAGTLIDEGDALLSAVKIGEPNNC